MYEHGLVDVDWTQQVGHPRHTLVVEEVLHQLIGGLSMFIPLFWGGISSVSSIHNYDSTIKNADLMI